MARTNITKRQIRFPISGANRDLLFAKLAEHDTALDSAVGDGTAASITELVTSGPLSLTTLQSALSVTGTVVFTLAAGTKIGQRKTLRQVVQASTPSGTVTGVFINAGTTGTTLGVFGAALTNFVSLVWNGTQWSILELVGVTLS